jgi:hypothetical protein
MSLLSTVQMIDRGENGTPDLTGKFLMGAASLSGAGETGGKANIKESPR